MAAQIYSMPHQFEPLFPEKELDPLRARAAAVVDRPGFHRMQSLTAKGAKPAKESNSLTAKGANPRRKIKALPRRK